ncbi:MAG: YkgJ family cysteine cluster protein, partial [Planctomycetota bacterium]
MPGILCEHCTGFCCRYIALPIEEPETRQDYDDIRWYLL